MRCAARWWKPRYPALLLTVGPLVVLFLLGVVVPRFAQLLQGAHKDLPLASSLLLSWGKTIGATHRRSVGTGGAGGILRQRSCCARCVADGRCLACSGCGSSGRCCCAGSVMRSSTGRARCWCKVGFRHCAHSSMKLSATDARGSA